MSAHREKAERFLRHLEPLQQVLEGYCRRYLHDSNAVADVLQSAIATAFRDFHLYVEGTNFRSWIFRYLHFETLNHNRRFARRQHDELPADLSVEDMWQLALDEPLFKVLLENPDAILQQCDADLLHAVRQLDPMERAVLLLKAIGEFTYREIAEILEVPIGTVMSRLARARLRLRQQLVRSAEKRGVFRARGERGKA